MRNGLEKRSIGQQVLDLSESYAMGIVFPVVGENGVLGQEVI